MKRRANHIATSSVILLVESVVRLIAVAALSFWIARRLGPSQFGVLNFASALVAILTSAATMGLDAPAILELTKSEQPGAVVGAVLALRFIAGLLTTILAFAIAYLLKANDPLALAVTLIVSLSIIGSTLAIFDYWFKARTAATLPAISRTSGTLVASMAKVVCLLLGFGVIALAWTVVLEAVVTGIGLTIAYFYATSGTLARHLSLSRPILVKLARESWPYLLSAVAINAYMKIDVVMLGYLSTSAETGIYSLSQKLSEVLYILPSVLVDSAYPTLARRFLDSGPTDNKSGQLLFDLSVGGALAGTVLAILIAGPIINMLFGPAYQRSIGIFYLHAWSCIAIAMNQARHRWFVASQLQRYAPTVTFIGLFTNVALNLVLIPMLGAWGAAIATVASYFLSGYLTSFAFPALKNIALMQTKALWPWGRLYESGKLALSRSGGA